MNQRDVPLQEQKQVTRLGRGNTSVWIVRVCLSNMDVDYVVMTKFNQNPFYKFFGKLKQKSRAYGAFTCNECSQSYASTALAQMHAINTVQSIKRTACDLLPLEPNFKLEKVHRVQQRWFCIYFYTHCFLWPIKYFCLLAIGLNMWLKYILKLKLKGQNFTWAMLLENWITSRLISEHICIADGGFNIFFNNRAQHILEIFYWSANFAILLILL